MGFHVSIDSGTPNGFHAIIGRELLMGFIL